MNLANRYYASSLNHKIRLKGRDEQELQYLFNGLYNGKAVTKNTIGVYKQYDRMINKKHYTPYPLHRL